MSHYASRCIISGKAESRRVGMAGKANDKPGWCDSHLPGFVWHVRRRRNEVRIRKTPGLLESLGEPRSVKS